MNRDATAIKYLVNVDYNLNPTFIEQPSNLLKSKQSTYIISEDKSYNNLPQAIKAKLQIITQGNIGHQDCYLLQLAN